MFRLKDNNAKFPPRYEHVERKKATVSDRGWDKVGGFTLRDNVDLIPQEGLQERLCQCESNLIFVCGQATSGKCAPLDSHVLTPKGFVEMGRLRVGDVVTGFDGGAQTVLDIFDQSWKDVYKFTLVDGAVAETSADHLWSVALRDNDRPFYPCEMTTKEIADAIAQGVQVILPHNNPVTFAKQPRMGIDMYALGLVIGSPTEKCVTSKPCVTADSRAVRKLAERGIFTYKSKSPKRTTKKPGRRKAAEYVDKPVYRLVDSLPLRNFLRFACLSGKEWSERFIPYLCLTASLDERRDLIDGIYDASGQVFNSNSSLRVGNERIADDLVFILRSLGVMVKKIKDEDGSIRLRTAAHGTERVIIKAEPSGRKMCRCIRVSNPDHLYLMDDFIVTHNTYGMMLKALSGVGTPLYTGRLINVRKLDSAKGTSMFRDASMVWGEFSNCDVTYGEMPTFAWPKWNNSIQMIHANFNVDNPQEWDAFQEYIKKQQASYICIDEATAIEQFKMFTYIFSRNRDSSGIEPCMVLSFNPKYGHWTTDFLVTGGYIDTSTWYIKPNMNGKTRYFYIKGDDPTKVVWGDTKEEVARAAHIAITTSDAAAGLKPTDMVKSFTLITGTAADNRKLVAATKGQSVANLHNVGATQRAVLSEAYFGPIENADVGITDTDIRNLATNPWDDDQNMYATMDVSGGKMTSDNIPMSIWKGKCLVGLEFFRGSTSELVTWIDQTLSRWKVDKRRFAFDATGIGYFLTGFTEGEPVTANSVAKKEYDADGNPVTIEQFFNLRSQLLSKTEVLIKTGAYSTALDLNMRIPYGRNGETRQLIDVLYDEKNVFRKTTRNKRIYYRSKDEYKARFKSSPDLMDTITLRAIWELDARPKKQPEREVEDDAYFGLYQNYSGRSTAWI